jgi:hypothetical protein
LKNAAELQFSTLWVVAASLNFALFTQNFEKDLSWSRPSMNAFQQPVKSTVLEGWWQQS